jgi:hypothetical protein
LELDTHAYDAGKAAATAYVRDLRAGTLSPAEVLELSAYEAALNAWVFAHPDAPVAAEDDYAHGWDEGYLEATGE